MKKICLYPGSFDPMTVGHLDIVQRLSPMFDEVVVAISINPDKKSFLPFELRLQSVTQAVSHLENVKVVANQGEFTVQLAHRLGASVMARGLRNVTDFDFELPLSQANSAMQPLVETIFLPTKPQHCFISSSLVRQIHSLNGDISKLVPPSINKVLSEKEK